MSRHSAVSAEANTSIAERVVRERIAGYQESCESVGLDFERIPLAEAGGFDLAAGVRAARTLLDGDVTAVATTSDTMAIAVLEVARERGLRVPEDLSVIGFDDAPMPSRTT